VSDLLLYGGIAIVGISLILGVSFFIYLAISKRKLNAKLDAEYGKRQTTR